MHGMRSHVSVLSLHLDVGGHSSEHGRGRQRPEAVQRSSPRHSVSAAHGSTQLGSPEHRHTLDLSPQTLLASQSSSSAHPGSPEHVWQAKVSFWRTQDWSAFVHSALDEHRPSEVALSSSSLQALKADRSKAATRSASGRLDFGDC